LHAAGGEALRNLLPQKRRELVPHDPVEHAARLLRVDLVHVELARVLEGLEDRVLRDLVEHDAVHVLRGHVERLAQVPRDRLALAVGVGREVDRLRCFREPLQLADDLLATADRLVRGLEALVDVDAEAARRQVAHVPLRRADDVARAEVLVDRAGLRGALDDHQAPSLGELRGLGGPCRVRFLLGRFALARLLGSCLRHSSHRASTARGAIDKVETRPVKRVHRRRAFRRSGPGCRAKLFIGKHLRQRFRPARALARTRARRCA
jgi:hypothetical protein